MEGSPKVPWERNTDQLVNGISTVQSWRRWSIACKRDSVNKSTFGLSTFALGDLCSAVTYQITGVLAGCREPAIPPPPAEPQRTTDRPTL